jgi:Domain of unknown function (DUF4442)
MSLAPSQTLAAASFEPDSVRVEKVARQMKNPFLIRLFLLKDLPLAFFAGLRVKELDAEHCIATVPYGWRTQNPFKSTYFAAQAMAAELSTGALGSAATRIAPSPVAMLIVNMEGQFGKKATGTTYFTCTAGREVFAAVASTCATGEAATVRAETVGRMADGTEVSRFFFTWSFKKRSK